MMVGRRMYDLFAAPTTDDGSGAHCGSTRRWPAPSPKPRHRTTAGPPAVTGTAGSGPQGVLRRLATGRRAGRRDRTAGRQRAAPGDHLHLLQGRLRRRRRQCVRSGLRLTTEPNARQIRRDRRPAHRRPAGGRPRRPRLLGVAGRPGTRHRRPPRRAAAGVQGDRRGTLRRRPGQGGLRHRDAGARHQHAGPHRGAGAADQVQRRGSRRPDAGGVHPADRPGRSPRHRRRGPRGRGLGARSGPAGRRRAGVQTHRIRSGRPSDPATTWPSTCTDRLGREAARELLEQSFAQFQANAAVVGVARQVRRNEEAIDRTRQVDGMSPRRHRGVLRVCWPELTAAEKGAREGRGQPQARGDGPRPCCAASAAT